jgi:3-oxoacyl-[acyl-carrier-protein] synthase II
VTVRSSRAVYVVATAALSPFGEGGEALLRGLRGEVAAASTALLAALPDVRAIGVGAVVAARDPVPAKARKTMSRAAYLAAVAMRALVGAAGWADRDGVGYFLGVGASGGSMGDLEAILAATFAGGRREGDGEPAGDVASLDLARFGSAGIPACNPLLAFQLMNNFTMCHGAILEGTTGPSGAFFSRGAGTIAALAEAREAVAGGACERAIAGGADSALHPVTWLEHARLADVPVRLPASEGAALLALSSTAGESARIVVEVAEQVTRADDPAARAAALVRGAGGPCDVVVVGADDPGQRTALSDAVTHAASRTATVLALDALGTCLAATPALGWVAALELLRAGARRAAVVTLDGAGDLSVAVLAREAEA